MSSRQDLISIIGLGKLGIPLSLSFASCGFTVIGYDINPITMIKLQSGVSPIIEPQVQEQLSAYKSNMVYTDDLHELVQKSEITFIVVPTPSNKDGSFSSHFIETAVKSLAVHIRSKKKKHTLVITSTVSIRTMEGVVTPLIEKETGKKVGKEIGLCYSPEFIALGSVIQNIKEPDLILIGESDKNSGDFVEKIRLSLCKNKPKVMRTNWINAEIAKVSLNSYITTKISFANMIARMCERIKGADSEVVLQAIGQDSRVGTKYLKGGLGYGGPCFPRDNISLQTTINSIDPLINLPYQVHCFNKKQIEIIFNYVKKILKKGQKVGILGLSYKPDTNVTDESQGMLLLQKLVREHIDVISYDPFVQQNANKILSVRRFVQSAEQCIEQADVIVITTPWNIFKKIRWNVFSNKIVIDCWRIIDLTKYDKKKNTFIQLGKYISFP